MSTLPTELVVDAEAPALGASPQDWKLALVPRLVLTVLLLTCVAIGARQIAWYWSHGPLYSDLKIFVTPIRMLEAGQGHQLYQFASGASMQDQLYPEMHHDGILVFNHLPYELLFYWPLASLPYRAALAVWGVINVGLVLLIAWMMRPFTEELRTRMGIPLELWLLGFHPVLFVLSQAQDSLLLVVLIVASLRFAARDRDFLAGLLLGVALFKIHLALAIGFFVLFVPRKWRGLAGFALSIALLAAISLWMVGPHAVRDYLQLLREQQSRTPWGFRPNFMPNIRGLLQCSLGRWLDLGLIQTILFGVSLLVVGVTWVSLRVRDASATTLYTAAVTATALVSYHMHMSDQAIATVPILLLIEASVRRRLTPIWMWTLAGSIGMLYLYAVAAWIFPKLLLKSFILSIPMILLWLVAAVAPTKRDALYDAMRTVSRGLPSERLLHTSRYGIFRGSSRT